MTASTSSSSDRAAIVAGLRALADRLESPDCPLPYQGSVMARLPVMCHDESELRSAVAALGGDKIPNEHYGFTVERTWGPVRTVIMPLYGACERVEVGTETVKREVEVCSWCDEELVDVHASQGGGRCCPAYDAGDPYGHRHDYFPAPVVRKVEVEVPRYETRCPPSLLAPREPETAA